MTDIVISTGDVIIEVPQPTVPDGAKPVDIGLVEIRQVVQRGSMWFTGNGAPSIVGGQVGDMYLDVDTGDIYQWNGTEWIYQGTFAPTTLTPEEILAMLVTVDGAGSDLDADKLDSHDSLYFATQADMDTANSKNAAQDATLADHENRIDAAEINITNLTASSGTNTADIDALEAALATETTNRTNADTTLTTNLAAEVTARTNADTALDAKITTEKNRNDAQDTAINLRLTDAPNDGKYYGRKSATWAKVTEEAPSDGLGYSRKNGAWAPSSGGAWTDDNPPAGPLQDGQFWWKSSTGVLYLWYDDGTSQQWVAASTGGAVTGNLDMQGYAIVNVGRLGVGVTAAPTNSTDTVAFFDGRISTIMGVYGNCYYDGANYKTIKAGWAHTLTMNLSDSTIALARSSASLAAGANITFTPMLSFNAGGTAALVNGLQVTGNISATGRMDASGNVTGNIIEAASYLSSQGPIWVNTPAIGAVFGLNRAGGARYFSWTSQWYFDWNETSGDMRYVQNGNVRTTWRTSDGALIHTVSATYKPGGGPWVDSSDSRIKDVKQPYTLGLDEVAALNPVIYSYLGNDTAEPPVAIGNADPDDDSHLDREVTVPYENSPHYQSAIDGQTFVGLIAQEVEPLFPGMVKKRSAFIDGQPVDDLRDLDTTSLIFALVNSVKALKARIEALEAR